MRGIHSSVRIRPWDIFTLKRLADMEFDCRQPEWRNGFNSHGGNAIIRAI